MAGSDKIFLFLVFIGSYIIGSIPFGYIIGLIKGVDIRKLGSGNIGATNVFRTIGKSWGIFCFILDFFKGFVPVMIAMSFAKENYPAIIVEFSAIFAMLGSFCGHNWTIFLGFRGGKGVATAAGGIFAIAPISVVLSLVVWALVFIVWRYVSLASISASIFLPFAYWSYSKLMNSEFSIRFFVIFCMVSSLSIIRHRSNIKRLREGTEHKFSKERKNA